MSGEAGQQCGPLPFMQTVADAVALCEKENDPFYLTAFMIEAWLGQVALGAAAEYAEKKNARDRQMQAGAAWQLFLEDFGRAPDNEFGHVFSSLLRFAEYDDVQAKLLRQALVPLSFEHECFSDYAGPKTMELARQPALAVPVVRRSVERWCDWLDALVHWNTHELAHLSPVQFDADAGKRELAALGINQRAYAHLNDFGKAWWHWHHGEAAQRFKDSPKWPMVGKAMAAQETRHWNYPEVDAAVIALWPLVKRHRWTYRDLLNVVCEVAPQLRRYPCEREADLATYCNNVLGLRKSAKGKTARNGRPKGHEVAVRLCQRHA
jgi:hypothetical protein